MYFFSFRMRMEEAEAVNLQVEEEAALKQIREQNNKKCKSLQRLKGNTVVSVLHIQWSL